MFNRYASLPEVLHGFNRRRSFSSGPGASFISSIKSYRRGKLRPTSVPSDPHRQWLLLTPTCTCEQWNNEVDDGHQK